MKASDDILNKFQGLNLGTYIMMKCQKHEQEIERLEVLKQVKLLDTPEEAKFDTIIHLASEICHTKIALFSLLDEERQWFKSKIGLDIYETARDVSFCGHTILGHDVLEICDTLKDTRFLDNPLVLGEPHIRFYAGAPVFVQGLPLGTLCVIDQSPKKLSLSQKQSLKRLALELGSVVELRQKMFLLEESSLILDKERLEIKQTQSKIINFLKNVRRKTFNL